MRDDPSLSKLTGNEQLHKNEIRSKQVQIRSYHTTHMEERQLEAEVRSLETKLEHLNEGMRHMFKEHCKKTVEKHKEKIQKIQTELPPLMNAFGVVETEGELTHLAGTTGLKGVLPCSSGERSHFN